MKFKFAYENVMKNKKIGRDVAHRNFTEARAELEKSESVLTNFEKEIRQARQLNHSVSENKIIKGNDLELLKWTQDFLEGQKIKISRQTDTIRQKAEISEEKALALSEAAKEYKIFEKLRERTKEKFKKLQKKMELKTTDEIVVMRAARQNNRFG